MNRKEIRRTAEERITAGYPVQHVYDELALANPKLNPKRIAHIVRFIPSMATRHRFRAGQQALLLAIVASGVLELAVTLADNKFVGTGTIRAFHVLPIATLFLGYSVYRWRGEVYQWVAFANGWSALILLGQLREMMYGEVDLWEIAGRVVSVLIAALAWHLHRNMFPKYRVVTDPVPGVPTRIVFPPDPGSVI